MNACPNCGNMNAAESNFCRFCGTKIIVQPVAMPAPQNPFDHPTPRPYAWKTDEFQTQNEARRGRHTGYVEGPTRPFEHEPEALEYRRPQNFARPIQCPRCLTQTYPRIEKRISTAGWITFAVLLVFFFPLFWIGLLIKEEVPICPNCMTKVA